MIKVAQPEPALPPEGLQFFHFDMQTFRNRRTGSWRPFMRLAPPSYGKS